MAGKNTPKDVLNIVKKKTGKSVSEKDITSWPAASSLRRCKARLSCGS